MWFRAKENNFSPAVYQWKKHFKIQCLRVRSKIVSGRIIELCYICKDAFIIKERNKINSLFYAFWFYIKSLWRPLKESIFKYYGNNPEDMSVVYIHSLKYCRQQLLFYYWYMKCEKFSIVNFVIVYWNIFHILVRYIIHIVSISVNIKVRVKRDKGGYVYLGHEPWILAL